MPKVVVQMYPQLGEVNPSFNSSGQVQTNWQGRTDVNSSGFGGTFVFSWGTRDKAIEDGITAQAVSQFAIAFAPLTITADDVQLFT